MKTTKQKALGYILFILFTGLFNLSAAAWGSTGHRAIAEIAYQQLTPEAKLKIAAVLGDNYLPLYATWPDDIRSDKNNPLGKLAHYADMELSETYETSKKQAHGDIITLLNQMINQLDNSKSTKEEKAIALKFIIHLVGDIHQPMHVGLAEDLGGNKIDVKWFGADSNLHKVWDENMIDYSRLSYTELARFAGTPDKESLSKMLNTSVVAWLDETHEFTKMIYENLDDKNFSYEYYYRFSPIVFQQIQKAGYRLGNLLNMLMR